MNRLALCALQESYSVKFGCSAERVLITGGHDRYVKSTNTKKHLVSVSFVLREEDFLYFRAFYQNWQLNPLPFLMKLIIEDDEYKDYIAQFVQNSCRFDELEGKIFKVSAQLTVFISPVVALTSKTYPLYHLESMATGFALNDGVLKEPITAETENIRTSFSIDSVTFRTPQNVTTAEIENLKTGFALDGVQITKQVSYLSMTAEVENLKTGFALDGVQITKTVGYLSTTMAAESMSTGFVLNSVQITN